MTTLNETCISCQVPGLGLMGKGNAKVPPESPVRRLKLVMRRHLSPTMERKLKMVTNDLANWYARMRGRPARPVASREGETRPRFEAGDLVRVRPRAEIDATLNHWRQLKGCTFMPEMDRYCGTIQRVLKPVERFVDERDLRVKKAKGLVLLEGAICEGTVDFGRCDRSCFLFWREEWLEKSE